MTEPASPSFGPRGVLAVVLFAALAVLIAMTLAAFATRIEPYLAVRYGWSLELALVTGQVLFQWYFLLRRPRPWAVEGQARHSSRDLASSHGGDTSGGSDLAVERTPGRFAVSARAPFVLERSPSNTAPKRKEPLGHPPHARGMSSRPCALGLLDELRDADLAGLR